MKRAFGVCLALCLIGGPTGARAVSTRTGDGMCCKSQKHHFCVTVPGRWSKVSQQQMDMFRAGINPDDTEYDFECVAAYGQDFVAGNPTSLIGVLVGHYKDKRRISNREIEGTVKWLTGFNIDKLERMSGRRHGRDRTPPNMKSLKTRDAMYSNERKRLVWDVEVEPHRGRRDRMQVNTYFGRKTIVFVIGIAPLGEFEKCDRALAGVDKSFRFDPGAEFQQIPWYESGTFAIVLIGVAAALLAYTFRKRKG
jgi:hypothetical protein